jgi:hypothetical protein
LDQRYLEAANQIMLLKNTSRTLGFPKLIKTFILHLKTSKGNTCGMKRRSEERPACHQSICTRCGEQVEVVHNRNVNGSPLCVTCAEGEPAVQVFVSDSGKGHEDLALKKKRRGEKMPFEEFKSGESFEFRTNLWRERMQRVDRDNDKYDKVIKDKETGETIFECHEPLSYITVGTVQLRR